MGMRPLILYDRLGWLLIVAYVESKQTMDNIKDVRFIALFDIRAEEGT